MRSTNRFTRAATRFSVAVSLVLALSAVSGAYTIVMRGGRQIEIPETFTVTGNTLTYEAAPGINITLQLATIDIPATERVNHEQPGSLLKHTEARNQLPAKGIGGQAAARAPRRTITNRDLQGFKKARVESESAYDRRRIELGLPSIEESRRRAAQEAEVIQRELAESRTAELQAESYWRERASELRTEISATDAQIDFVRVRLSQIPNGFTAGFNSIAGVSFVSGFSRVFPFVAARPGGFAPPFRGGTFRGSIGFGGGATRGQVLVNPVPDLRSFRARSFPLFSTAFAWPFQSIDFSGERYELVIWLDRLVAYREALWARWRLLEDEARRAGAPPGWLR